MNTDTQGWHGVDLDGTLATYDKWRGVEHIGAPVKPMVDRVRALRASGVEVRIFTARVYPLVEFEDPTYLGALPSLTALEAAFPGAPEESDAVRAAHFIRLWCAEHLGEVLPITCRKDKRMIYLWDDRAVAVQTNTGITHHDQFSLSRSTHAQLARDLEIPLAALEINGRLNFHQVDETIRAALGELYALADGADDALGYINADKFKGGDGSQAFRDICSARRALRNLATKLKAFRPKEATP